MSQMFHTTQKVADMLDISRETLRSWCTTFENYLSPTARPGQGKRRQFTESDLKVFATVAKCRNDGMQFDGIGAVLASGQRENIDEVKSLAPRGHENQIVILKQQIVELQGLYQNSQVNNAKLQGEIDALTRQLKEALEKNDKLNREIGALESKQ